MIKSFGMLIFSIGIALCTFRMSVDLFEHSYTLSIFFAAMFCVCVMGVFVSITGIIDALYQQVRGFKRVDRMAKS